MSIESKPLFHPEVTRQHVRNFDLPPHVAESEQKIQKWADLISSGQADKHKETDLLPDFLTDFFYEILGYTRPSTSSTAYTLSREKHVEIDGKYADAVLGRFSEKSEEFIVALEGKGSRDPLDRPFKGRKMSAVDQAYRYAINLPCDWIIVTSMRETRLYHKGSDQHSYERFETVNLASDPLLLKRFVFLLGAERVVPQSGHCHLSLLLKESEKVGTELTNEFYSVYVRIRRSVLDQLRLTNPDIEPEEILRCTQKLLDRVLFCAFCEDRGLLPPESLKQAFQHSDPYNPRPIWDNFLGLFRAIDKGNDGLKIPAYNGGLFAHDETLDSLSVTDEICSLFKDIGEYEYRAARELVDEHEEENLRSIIDVDILGHIFEQSITDLERLRQDIDNDALQVDDKKAKSRRKKEGAFYTPPFITRYMIEQALGGVLKKRFESLRASHAAKASGTAPKALVDPNAYDLEAINEPQRKALIRFWEAWQEELSTIRILDPACGSGAFLIEAFDQLYAQFEISNARLEELRGFRTLFDLNREILQNNLYGVDLNPEAIQICQLSLWIKTAERGKALTSLDHTICEGNSVVGDSSIHPKAFNWSEAFPEVTKQGGFDVIIGNPPYIRQEWLAPFKPYWQNRFKSYHGVADIFTYFFEQGIEVLREGGKLAYITSGSWVRGNFGGPLRKYLSENTKLESMVDFGEFQPFPDAEMIRPSITILSKEPSGGEMKLFKWLTSGRPPETLSDEVAKAPTLKTNRLSENAWELEADVVTSLKNKVAKGHPNLAKYVDGKILYGVKTGLNDVFVINRDTKESLISKDPRSAEVIKPFIQGTHMRPWYIEDSEDYLIFTRRGIDIDQYPAIREYLENKRESLEPKPADYDDKKGKWPGRKSGNYEWFEIQDTVDYWRHFETTKIIWPDIAKLPRFSMDYDQRYLGNTGYAIPGEDYYLLGVLSSWVSWFYISKTAQPLRLRGDRWQYRLIAQYMGKVPIPTPTEEQSNSIASLAKQSSKIGKERYLLKVAFEKRIIQGFGADPETKLNQKAQSWPDLTINQLGEALKTSFKLPKSPMKSPTIADEWEPYLEAKQQEYRRLSAELSSAEAELNDQVYKLFKLTPDEIQLLQKEVEH